MKTRLLLELL
ncbi:hypothetical protein D047_4707A, partial [Vibrio parahaemolyticus VPTS-2010_2]